MPKRKGRGQKTNKQNIYLFMLGAGKKKNNTKKKLRKALAKEILLDRV